MRVRVCTCVGVYVRVKRCVRVCVYVGMGRCVYTSPYMYVCVCVCRCGEVCPYVSVYVRVRVNSVFLRPRRLGRPEVLPRTRRNEVRGCSGETG